MSNFCRSPGFKVVLSLGSSWWSGVPREHGALPGDYASVRGLVVWWRIVMKPVARALLLLGTFGSILAYSRNPKAQHVIIVIHENRTPDNLFQDPNLVAAGADIVDPKVGGLCHETQVPLVARPLNDCYGPDHHHDPAWLSMYDGGKMDGACRIHFKNHCRKSTTPRRRDSSSRLRCTTRRYATRNSAGPTNATQSVSLIGRGQKLSTPATMALPNESCCPAFTRG
jgi:hypothetical protein